VAADESTRKNPLGPVGGYVIANLTELRQARRLAYRELAERLTEIGRVIPVLGLSRIEDGNRRVDADDLVALAIALGVSPAALLLPRFSEPDVLIDLAQRKQATARAAWAWADGQFPLVASGAPPLTWRQITDFETHARPEWQEPGTLTRWRDDMQRRTAQNLGIFPDRDASASAEEEGKSS
jgi:transcriptional regulator with XRE-family HTH domain